MATQSNPAFNDTPLPHPEVDKIAYGELLSPERWNVAHEQIDDNFAALAGGRTLVVETVAGLATRPAVATGGTARLALVVAEMAWFIYVEGEADIAISELEFFGSLRRVQAPAGAWYQIGGAGVFQHRTETETLNVAAGATNEMFLAGLAVNSDGARPVTVTVNADSVIHGEGFYILTVLVDGQVVTTSQMDSGVIAHLSVLDLAAGDHTITARLLAQGGQGGVVVTRRTITARVG